MTKLDALYTQFQRLAPGNHEITSDPCDMYNCVAWVERDQSRWWEPGFYWPLGDDEPDPDNDLAAYIEMFEHLGFEITESPELDAGVLKIALFTDGRRFHHVAKQLPSGRWSSKAGPLHDLRHDDLSTLENVGIFAMTNASVFMQRPYDGTDPFELEEGERKVILPVTGRRTHDRR